MQVTNELIQQAVSGNFKSKVEAQRKIRFIFDKVADFKGKIQIQKDVKAYSEDLYNVIFN